MASESRLTRAGRERRRPVKKHLSAHDIVHFITAVMFFGLVILFAFRISQGNWPTRDEVGVTGFALMGGGVMGLVTFWWLADDDKGDFF